MVVFICNACGVSIKKNQVEHHYKVVCRRCDSVSCMDCGKDFHRQTFQEHIKCISEKEKYFGNDWKPKENENKGEKKQEAWLSTFQQITTSKDTKIPQNLRVLISRMRDYNNIPRKRTKFLNFVVNCLCVDNKQASELWDLIEAHTISMKNVSENSKIPADNVSQPKGDSELASSKTEIKFENTESNILIKSLNKRERKLARSKKTGSHRMENKTKHSSGQDLDSVHQEDKKVSKKRKRERIEAVDECGDVASSATNPVISVESNHRANGDTLKKRRKVKVAEPMNGVNSEHVVQAETESGQQPSEREVERARERQLKRQKKEFVADPCRQMTRRKAGLACDTIKLNDTLDPCFPEGSGKLARTFDWERIILAIVSQSAGQQVSLKKLRKRVVAAYESRECGGRRMKTKAEVLSKLQRKLTNMDTIRVQADSVSLSDK